MTNNETTTKTEQNETNPSECGEGKVPEASPPPRSTITTDSTSEARTPPVPSALPAKRPWWKPIALATAGVALAFSCAAAWHAREEAHSARVRLLEKNINELRDLLHEERNKVAILEMVGRKERRETAEKDTEIAALRKSLAEARTEAYREKEGRLLKRTIISLSERLDEAREEADKALEHLGEEHRKTEASEDTK